MEIYKPKKAGRKPAEDSITPAEYDLFRAIEKLNGYNRSDVAKLTGKSCTAVHAILARYSKRCGYGTEAIQCLKDLAAYQDSKDIKSLMEAANIFLKEHYNV